MSVFMEDITLLCMTGTCCRRSSSLKPVPYRIFICLKMVLFPDSPAPAGVRSGSAQVPPAHATATLGRRVAAGFRRSIARSRMHQCGPLHAPRRSSLIFAWSASWSARAWAAISASSFAAARSFSDLDPQPPMVLQLSTGVLWFSCAPRGNFCPGNARAVTSGFRTGARWRWQRQLYGCSQPRKANRMTTSCMARGLGATGCASQPLLCRRNPAACAGGVVSWAEGGCGAPLSPALLLRHPTKLQTPAASALLATKEPCIAAHAPVAGLDAPARTGLSLLHRGSCGIACDARHQ